MQKKHVHTWKPATLKVMPHKKSRKDFVDTLMQWKCDCGEVETVNLERKIL